MKTSPANDRRRRGTVTVWVAVAMVPMIGFLALVADYGYATVSGAALQNYADAKALAHTKEILGLPVEPVKLARYVPGQDATPDDQLPIKGAWRFDTGKFTTPAHVTTPGVPASSFDRKITHHLLLGGFFGVQTQELRAHAVAFVKKRHVAIVQDVSGSMGDLEGGTTRMEASKEALRIFVDFMRSQDMPGDHVGLVSFGKLKDPNGFESIATVDVPMSLLTVGTTGALQGKIAAMKPEGGTPTDLGIDSGLQMIEAEPDGQADHIMILVSDGQPNSASAANAARDRVCASPMEIQFNTIRIGPGNDQPAPCHNGDDYNSPTAEDVKGILITILSRQRVRLVE
jgi:hypothetical protein